jgi:hypothetical protein
LRPSKQFLQQQDQNARNEAISKGYRNISIRQIAAGKGHGRLPDEVLDYFRSLIVQKKDLMAIFGICTNRYHLF